MRVTIFTLGVLFINLLALYLNYGYYIGSYRDIIVPIFFFCLVLDVVEDN